MTSARRRFLFAGACAAAILLGVPGFAAADAGVNIAATEGQPFSGRVLTTNCALQAATIDWGDGTPTSAGRDAGTPSGAAGDHTYAEEGSYTGTVTYSTACLRFGAAHFQASVADAGLSANGHDLSGAQGQLLSGQVAHFTDADSGGTVSDFSAQIGWGDGTTTAGTLTAAAGGGFDVSGGHTYATPGSFAVSVRITDVGGSAATAAARATVTSAGPPSTGAPPPPARPRIVRINALAPTGANAPIVLNAVTDRPARSISWNLAGDSRPEITCSGAQTAVAFRAPAGSRSVSATALGDGGAGPTLATSFAVAPAPALSRAQRLIAAKVNRALAKHAPVYTCTAPGDYTVKRVGNQTSLTDKIVPRQCGTPRTVVAAGLQFEGCLLHLTSENQIPAAMRGMLPSFGSRVGLGNSFFAHSSISSVDLTFGLVDAYITYGDVKVNGLTLRPEADAAIAVVPQLEEIVSSNAQMAVGNIDLQNQRSFIMNLAPRGGSIPLGSFARAAGALGDIAGFALGGAVRVALDDAGGTFGLTIHVHLSLPSFLQVGGVNAQGDVTLRATNADGLVIDNLRIGPIDAEVAGLGVQALQLDYTRASREWDGQGKACIIDGACLDMIPPNGGVVIRGGSLVRAEASLEFPAPGIELFAGVALNRIGFGIGLDPTRILANAKITAEGVLVIDGHLVLAFPSAASPFILDRAEVGDAFPGGFYNRSYTQTTFAIAADASFDLPLAGPTRLGGAYLLYQVPGYVGFGGGIDANFAGIVSLTGRVDGEFNFENGRFSIKGDIEACVADVICAGAIGAISDHGAGGCVHIGTFFGDINIGGGVGFNPFHIYFWPFDGCRWSPFVDTNVFSGRRAQATAAGAPFTVRIKRGDRSRAIRLDGVGGAPSLRVRTPGGTVLTSSAGSGLALSPAVRIIRSERERTTVVGLVNPAAGTYTIELLPGSPAVSTISQATDQPRAHISASVRGRGARRTLVYNVARRVDQRVTFIEQARGGTRIIGTVAGGGRGRISFTPAPGFDGRTVVAQFELAGLPAERMTVARFTPVSPRLNRPVHLRVTRRGNALQISWAAVGGATRYEAVARLSFGGERLLRTGRTTITLRRVAGYDGGRISVRALATLRQSPPAVVALRPVSRQPTRLLPLPRPPRRR